MDRRNVFRILAAVPLTVETGVCQHSGHQESVPGLTSYKPRFFTADEYRVLDALCETILPADQESGGAHDAGVAFYIDTKLFHSDEGLRNSWRRGLAAIDAVSHQQSGHKFIDLEAASRSQLVSMLLTNEASPASALDLFAVRLKTMTIEGFCFSDTGFQSFGYHGNTALTEFLGCTHPEHKARAD